MCRKGISIKEVYQDGSTQEKSFPHEKRQETQLPGVVACPKCGEPRLPHRACKACGYYNGREVIAVESAE